MSSVGFAMLMACCGSTTKRKIRSIEGRQVHRRVLDIFIRSRLRTAHESGETTVKANRGYIISTFLNQLDSTTKDFCRMKWVILRTEATDEVFVSSDNPLVLDDIDEKAPLGTKNPNIEITMPLDPRTVALARWEEGGGVGYTTINTEYISTINQRTIEQAHR